jgi:hypothetical protein
VRVQVLTATSMKMTAFWSIARSLVEGDRRFRSVYFLDHQENDGRGSTHLWNVGLLQRDYTALYPRWRLCTSSGILRRLVWCNPTTRHGKLGGEKRYSSYSFLTSALSGVSGQRHDPAALYPRENYPLTPLDRKLDGTHSWSGHRD